jgi:hypothetical protein
MNNSNTIAFLRIPRCGTTSLLSTLIDGSNKTLRNKIILLDHGYCYKTDFYDPYNIFYKDHDENRKFQVFKEGEYKSIYALVRNPFSLLKSYYYHINVPLGKGWAGCNDIYGFNSWEDFLEAYIDPNFQWHLPPMKQSLFSMAYNKNNSLILNRYFKIENLNNINQFLIHNGFNPLSKLNSSTTPDKIHYTSLQIKKLNKIWERDLKYFNYKYEGQ